MMTLHLTGGQHAAALAPIHARLDRAMAAIRDLEADRDTRIRRAEDTAVAAIGTLSKHGGSWSTAAREAAAARILTDASAAISRAHTRYAVDSLPARQAAERARAGRDRLTTLVGGTR
jgi:beta-lactamase class A